MLTDRRPKPRVIGRVDMKQTEDYLRRFLQCWYIYHLDVRWKLQARPINIIEVRLCEVGKFPETRTDLEGRQAGGED